jgi:hypothetical protein
MQSVSRAEDQRKAGQLLIWLFSTPMGEEILEGTMGGALAGLGQLGQDQPLEKTLLQTIAAMGGGIALGMAGRKLGARIGKALHKGELKDQSGALATLARMGGSETTAAGIGEQIRLGRGAVEEGLMYKTSTDFMREALADPAWFATKYDIPADVFQKVMPVVQAGRGVTQAARTWAEMTPTQREAVQRFVSERVIPTVQSKAMNEAQGRAAEMLGPHREQYEAWKQQLSELGPIADAYEKVERLVTERAAQEAKRFISKGADASRRGAGGGFMQDLGISDAIESLNDLATPVTGEHVGRFAGRFIGDEVGVIGGLVAGGMLADSLGIQNPKDKKIAELEEQLASRQR